ncbi:MAG: threonylcarbamoyl-AMP synthase [Bacteroidetes bacterium]|nr:threonylcarbamoyl-AMP synthase [Bacteroidota bacterium]
MQDFKAEENKSLEILRDGGVILYPTDTIWGLGCDATNDAAIEKIYAIKQRNESKSMIVLLDDAGKLVKYVKNIPAVAYDIIELTEKPLTIIYDGAVNVSKKIISHDGSIAIRITKDAFCRDIIRRMNKPLVSTSANKSGEPSPENFAEIGDEIKSKADYIVSLRQQEKQHDFPSSIIKLSSSGEIKIIRK